jgi:hypothetical protein
VDQSHVGAKLTYSAPEIESLGTIAEITAGGPGNQLDGAGYGASQGSPGGSHGS